MKEQKRYMVLVDYENTIQGELCMVAYNLTLKEAKAKRKELIQQQLAGDILEDFIIHDVKDKGIWVVEYTQFIY